MNNEQQPADSQLEWIWERCIDLDDTWNPRDAKNRVWQQIRARRFASLRRRVLALTSAAAVVAVGVWLLLANRAPQAECVPVRQFATQTRAVELSLDDRQVAVLAPSSRVVAENHALQIVGGNQAPAQRLEARPAQYATITVPPGGQYSLTLCDGTVVCLNSDSRLRYPIAFTGAERRVELAGEAYFEVTSDAAHPFVVSTSSGISTRVLGTRFNMAAYPEAPCAVTLLEGRVGVSSPLDSCLLQPGLQARVGDGPIDVRSVDTEMCVSWMHGRIGCDTEPLSVLVGRLSRHYDTEVYIGDPTIEPVLFCGYLPYNLSLEEVLDMLHQSERIRYKKTDQGYMLYL